MRRWLALIVVASSTLGTTFPTDLEVMVPIPRAVNLSLSDFWELYADTQTPVIIEDYAPCFRGMSRVNLARFCGGAEVHVARRVSDPGRWGGFDFGSDTLTLAEALAMRTMRRKNEGPNDSGNATAVAAAAAASASASVGTTIGVFDWSLVDHCPELLRRHYVVPKYFAQVSGHRLYVSISTPPGWLNTVPPNQRLPLASLPAPHASRACRQDFQQRIPRNSPQYFRDSWPTLFLGLNGSYGAPHVDSFGSAFWQFVVEGAKEWHIVDAYEGADLFNDATPSGWGGLTHYVGLVQAGELLYIPGGTPHQVTTLSRTRFFLRGGNTLTCAL